MTTAPKVKPPLSVAQVATWLRANPRFLAENPALYRVLAPPQRVHGERLADHMAAMLRAERMHAAAMAERADGVLAAGRAAAGLAGRVNEAVIALLRADSGLDCISGEFPSLLAVDAVSLCVEADLAETRMLPRGMVTELIGRRGVVFRDAPEDAAMIYGEAARMACFDALVRIPGEGAPMLLALAARDKAALDPVQGAGALIFLGRATAAALGR